MPTIKPRVLVSLSETNHNLLRNLAKLQGVSMSAVMSDLFETAAPALERVAVLLQQAQDAPEHVKAQLRNSLERAQEYLEPQAAGFIGQTDFFLHKASSQLSAGADAAPRPQRSEDAGSGPRPPSSNRGVRSTRKTLKNRK